MTLVIDKFLSILPPKKKTSPSGWISFNAPCCHHRGHKPDTRKRAGVRFEGNGIIYNCFNCKFTTGWQPGSSLGEKLKTLCRWMGADDSTIKEMFFESLKTESDPELKIQAELKIEFPLKSLPDGSLPLIEWANLMEDGSVDDITEDFSNVLGYLMDRGYEDPFSHDFHWTPVDGFRDRVIIPFRYENEIVGFTARKIRDGRPKYISDQSPNFVFNFDQQKEDQKYILIVEGPFDALAIGGIALLSNEISEQQARLINSLPAQKIVIPDQDRPGMILIDRAAELGWSVASPNWSPNIKDSAEAVKRYGKIFVVVDAVITAVEGAIKLSMAKTKLKNKLQRIEDEKDF
jgi:hypothetical protein